MFNKRKKKQQSQQTFDFSSYYNSSSKSNYNSQNNYNSSNNNSNYNPYGNQVNPSFTNTYNNNFNNNVLESKKSSFDFIKWIKIGVFAGVLIVLIVLAIFFFSKDIAPKPLNIALDFESLNLGEGNSKKITYKLNDKTIPFNISFKSSNPEIATVDENGKVLALKNGETSILITYTENQKDYELICHILVSDGTNNPSCKLDFNGNVVKATYSNATQYGFTENFDGKTEYTLEYPNTKSESGTKDIPIKYYIKNDDEVYGSCSINITRNCECKYEDDAGKCYKKILRTLTIAMYKLKGYNASTICKDAQKIDSNRCYWYTDEGMDCTFKKS